MYSYACLNTCTLNEACLNCNVPPAFSCSCPLGRPRLIVLRLLSSVQKHIALYYHSLSLSHPFKVQMNGAVMGTSLVRLYPPVSFPICLSVCWEGDGRSRKVNWMAAVLNQPCVREHNHTCTYWKVDFLYCGSYLS